MSSLREWHGFENSVRWRLVPEGVEIEGSGVERTRGRPDMVTRVWNTFGDEINQVARARKVPCPLIIATICTESGGKPDATRHEPGYTSDEATPHRVSIGLTQTLISTAREVMKMKVDGAWLRQPYNAINAGAGYIEKQSRSTKLDPPLVAAAYNAGSLVRNDGPKNRWKLRQYPIGTSEHCDRFVKFYNDAVFMLASHSRRPAVGHEALLEGYAPVRSSAPAPAPREEPARVGGGGGGGWGGFGQLGGFGGLAGLGGLFGGSGGSAAGPFGSTGAPGTPGSEAEVVFGENAHRDGVTPYSLKVLREILVSAGLKKCTISSTSRSPAEQARVMFNNLERYGVDHQMKLYARGGQQVIQVYAARKSAGDSAQQIKSAMERKIVALGPTTVSRHASDPRVLNVFDVAPSSITDRANFERAVRADKRVNLFLTPPKDPGYHLEIPQP